MPDTMATRSGAAVSFAPADEAVVAPLLARLSADGLVLQPDAAAALLFFTSQASLGSDACFEQARAAHEAGVPVIPVLLAPFALPGDLPPRFAALLRADRAVDAFERPDEEKRRGILRALAMLGIAGGGAGIAEAGTIGAENVTPQAASAPSTSSARALNLDPLAKSNAGVVKASSTISMKIVAFGGAAVATLLVVGAVVLMQNDTDRLGAPPASPAATGPSTASAAPEQGGRTGEPRPTPADIETGGARATLQRSAYPVGYPIPVRFEGMPGHARDYVAITEAGATGIGETRYEFLKGQKDGEIILRPVMKPGSYELRLYFGNDEETGRSDRVRFTTPLTITPADPITLTPEASSVPEGRAIRLRYEGLPGNDKDWLSTALAGSKDGDYISYRYTNGATAGEIELPPLMKPGLYEVRVYFDDITSDRTVQARIPIEVTPAPPVRLTLDAAAYAPGARIAVTFSDLPGNQKDWLALGRPGDDGYLSYEYTGGETSGTQSLSAPDEPGEYEVRAYFDDATGDRTVRAMAPFRVDAAAAPPPP